MQNNYEETENVLKEVQSDYKEKQNDVLSLFVVMLRLSQSCRGCLSVSLIAPQMRRMHEREARESSCVCRAAGGPPALTLAARSARLLIPLSGCRLPCLPSLPPSSLLWTRWLGTYRSSLFSSHFLFILSPRGIKGNEGNPLTACQVRWTMGKWKGSGRWMWFIMRLLSFCRSTPGTAVWNGTPRL